MNLPTQILRAIHFLYQHNEAYIQFYGATGIFIYIASGIRQCCPLSGTLWALLFDPVVRCLNLSLGIPATIVGYADDLAATAKDMHTMLTKLMAFFDKLSAVAGLELNYPKIVIISCSTMSRTWFATSFVLPMLVWAKSSLLPMGSILGR